MSTKIRSILIEGTPEREVSTAVDVLPYAGQGLGGLCACGCGRQVEGERSSKKYATTTCRKRAFKRTAGGDANFPLPKGKGDANSEERVSK